MVAGPIYLNSGTASKFNFSNTSQVMFWNSCECECECMSVKVLIEYQYYHVNAFFLEFNELFQL